MVGSKVSFAARDTPDSLWRKRGSLPRFSDHLQGNVVDVDLCDWVVNEATPIRALAQEMVVVGLQGFELVWIAGWIVLLSFSTVDLCDGLLASTNMWSAWFGRLELWSHTGCYLRVDAAMEEPSSFERVRVLLETSFPGWIDEVMQVTVQDSVYTIVIQEAELVRVPIVEHRDEESESKMGDKPHEASVASPELHVSSEHVRVVSLCWRVNQLWDSRCGRAGRASLDGAVGGMVNPRMLLWGMPERLLLQTTLLGVVGCV
ncbi:hypothetical protein V6N11_013114 [Hibiscus sabdariffa]|uniref:Uncharacterized protein n=2 Tax=Hibiscus sabdariffa TaxID=183260 RepID=A0ABR2B6B6_9ROSI